MTKKDYRIIMTIAANLAKPCIWEGKKTYEVDLEQFIKAVDNIYPDLYIPVVISDGKVLNPKVENKEN
jgi:hypothetical protein